MPPRRSASAFFDYTLTVGNTVQLRTDGMSLDRECILPADKALPRQRLCSLKERQNRRGKAAETGIQPLGGTEPHIAACGGIRSGTKSHSAVHCKCTLVSERVYLLAHEPLKPEQTGGYIVEAVAVALGHAAARRQYLCRACAMRRVGIGGMLRAWGLSVTAPCSDRPADSASEYICALAVLSFFLI